MCKVSKSGDLVRLSCEPYENFRIKVEVVLLGSGGGGGSGGANQLLIRFGGAQELNGDKRIRSCRKSGPEIKERSRAKSDCRRCKKIFLYFNLLNKRIKD